MISSVLLVWIISVIISVPPVIFYGNTTGGNRCLVSQEPAYQIISTITAFYAPMLLMMIAYANILILVRKILKMERNVTATQSLCRSTEENGSTTAQQRFAQTTLFDGQQRTEKSNLVLTLKRRCSNFHTSVFYHKYAPTLYVSSIILQLIDNQFTHFSVLNLIYFIQHLITTQASSF